ncbi:MAG TPA: hypothetical protein EYH59_02370 [Pyrodictium sp.]|nr:hypothetical protein [Pyrodictium sp.]
MIQCIKLPYKIRNVDQLKKLIDSYVAKHGNKAICFGVEQLVHKIYLCKADSLEIVWREIKAYDRLSGLYQKLKQPGLKFRETIIWLKWDGTTFVLEASAFQRLVEMGVCIEKIVV